MNETSIETANVLKGIPCRGAEYVVFDALELLTSVADGRIIAALLGFLNSRAQVAQLLPLRENLRHLAKQTMLVQNP